MKFSVNAKYFRQFPQIKDCVVTLRREPEIEEMVKTFGLPIRKSARLLVLEEKNTKAQGPIPAKTSQPARRKCTTPKRKPTADSPKAVKSILVGNNRLRARSKSVSFDPTIASPSAKRSKVAPVSRNLFGSGATSSGSAGGRGPVGRNLFGGRAANSGNNGGPGPSGLAKRRRASLNGTTQRSVGNSSDMPVDLSTQRAQNSADINGAIQPEVANNADDTTNQHLIDSTDTGLSSGEKLAYENRIENLVQSNQRKINRIQELLADRTALLAQIDGLHRVNRAFAAAVDEYEAERQNNPTQGIIHTFLIIENNPKLCMSNHNSQVDQTHQMMYTNNELRCFKVKTMFFASVSSV